MTWRLRAGPGSFRGVPFQVDADRLRGGRKIVTHEYPLRDEVFIEDLGQRGPVISVTGYVVGNDYIEQRDALLAVLQQEGPGRLVLPYMDLESKRFALADFEVETRREEGGIAWFTMEFLETAAPLFPVDVPDLTAQVDAGLAAAFDTLEQNFLASYDITGAPPFTFESLASVVAAAGTALDAALAPVAGALGTVTGAVDQATAFAADVKRQVDRIILDADQLVRAPLVAVDRFRDLFEAVFESPALPPRNIDALLEAYEFKSETPAPKPVTTNRAREAANYEAIESLIKRMALVSAARFAPRSDFDSYEQAVVTRERLTELLDDQAETASDEVYQALLDLRAALVRAVPGEGSDLPRLLTFTPITTLPSLVIAHRIYGNLDKELDLVARNNIRHPGFVLGGRTLEVLGDA